ncbi:MAG: prepilin peptidase [Candidatus Sungbacteria bacterium]|nr:prepilin peptidase [Candidatus Sungbacteria bacterium]
MVLYYIFSFLFGLGVGSFLNVVILRGARGESFVKGRSRCESCGKTLQWFELIPLASFFIQKARCRSCGAKLSWQYPLVEFATGLLFALIAIYYSPSGVEGIPLWLSPRLAFELMFAFVIPSASIVILVSDIRWKIIPNGAVVTLLVVSLIRESTRLSLVDIGYDVGAALGLAFFFFALWFLSRGAWMGFGDVKLVLATSFLLGFPASIPAVLFSFWIGAAFGVILLALRVVNLKTQIPFGPFILAGSAAAYFYSETALWYIGMSMG